MELLLRFYFHKEDFDHGRPFKSCLKRPVIKEAFLCNKSKIVFSINRMILISQKGNIDDLRMVNPINDQYPLFFSPVPLLLTKIL